MAQFFVQDPSEEVEYQISWTGVLPTSVTILTSSWVAPAAIVLENEAVDGDFTAVFVKGGVKGSRYTITNTVTLTNGEVYSDSLIIYFEEK